MPSPLEVYPSPDHSVDDLGTGAMPGSMGCSAVRGWKLEHGRIEAPVLEIIVAEQCNLSCRACSHLSPVAAKGFVDRKALARDLDILRSAFVCNVVKLIGGEPLLHPDLAAIVDAVRRSGIGEEIHLVTNGLIFGSRAFDPAGIDQVTVSRYPSRPLPKQPMAFLAALAAQGVRTTFIDMAAFQESYCETMNDDAGLLQAIYSRCKIAHQWCCFTLFRGHFYKCPQAYAIPQELGLPELGSASVNGVDLHDPTLLESGMLLDRLHAYLDDAAPLAACRACLGSAGRTFEHENAPRAGWRRRQQRPFNEMVDTPLLAEIDSGR